MGEGERRERRVVREKSGERREERGEWRKGEKGREERGEGKPRSVEFEEVFFPPGVVRGVE
jgi:hypothetical protein